MKQFVIAAIVVSGCLLFLPAESMAGCAVPVPEFSADPTSLCPGGTVAFTDLSTNMTASCTPTYTWTFPGGAPASSNSQNPSVVYSTVGTYSVTLTIDNNNAAGPSTLTKPDYITVFDTPIVNLGADVTWQCVSQLDASNASATYMWSTGETTATIIPPSSGNYSVTVTRCGIPAGDDINITLISAGCPSPLFPIAAGSYHSLALCNNNTMMDWGFNNSGQLGDNTLTNRSTPVEVHGVNNVGFFTGATFVAAGELFSLAVKNDGTVWAWGNNSLGQLGNNTSGGITKTPAQVHGTNDVGFLTGIINVAAGRNHSLAVKNDGTVWTWGYNFYGQLGDNTTTNKLTPVQVHGANDVGFLTGITAVAAGAHSVFSLALKNDGTVWAWGDNSYGKLGDNTGTQRNVPVQVHGTNDVGFLTGITAVAAGAWQHSLALKNDGTVWTWGRNGESQLGDNTTTDRSTPVQVHGTNDVGFLTGITAIAAGPFHSLALKNDGTVWAWGWNAFGELGDNTTTPRNTPVNVLGGASGSTYLTGITSIAASGTWVGSSAHSLALKNDGTVWGWGSNGLGQLGDNTTIQRNTPVQAGPLCLIFPLPIELLSFSALCLGDKADIKWSTASETNNDYFEIQRNNGMMEGWKVVGAVQGAGNSNTTKHYSFIDTDIPSTSTPQPSTLLYYRLKQTDYDGKYEYFVPVSVKCENGNFISVYPNPAGEYIHYTIGSKEGGTVTIKMMDVLGREVLRKEEMIEAGVTEKKLSTVNLSSGAYLLKMTNGNFEKTQKQFVVK